MRKILLIMVALAATMAAWAQDVPYVDANGDIGILADGSYSTYDGSTELTAGWWVVGANRDVSSRITVTGVVHLVLMDGVTLNANNGIKVESGNELHIYAQGGDYATLNATAIRDNEAGIGGNIHASSGTIEVNGGHVIAKGGKYAAGIGGGGNGYWSGKYGSGGTFIINAGHVEATGGDNGGAGIGGGGYSSANSITGGDGGVVTINGGIVEARGGKDGYGVGPGTSGWDTGRDGEPATLSLGWRNPSDYIYMSTVKANVTINSVFFVDGSGETVTADSDLNGKTLYPYDGETYTVTFMVDGEQYAKRQVIYGGAVTEPARPVKAGKTFEYWYASDATQAYDFATPVTADLTLNAHFRDFAIQTDEAGNYLIGSESDWSEFTQIISDSPDANAKLTADVQLSDLSPMLGSDNVKYAGNFDGAGHTLTVAYNTRETFTAPFRYTNGATISNLIVDGTITTSAKYAAGIIANAYGNTSLTNCVSKVAITSTVNGDGTHGGLVAVVQNTTSLANCVFAGKLLGNNTNSCGGFVGWKSGVVNFIDCLFIPAEITINTNNCSTYSRNTPSSVTRCYYTETLGEADRALFVAQLFAGEGVTLNGTPNISYDGKDYYTPGSNVTLDYALPEGKFFDHYEVSNGTISDPTVMSGDHVLSGFTADVTVTGSHVDSRVDLSADGSIDPIDDVVYNKSAQEPAIVVKVGDQVLTPDINYTIEWVNNVNVGEATLTVTGIGRYYGELTAKFNIAPRGIDDSAIKAKYTSKYGSNGETIHPLPVLTYGDYTLVLDTDYTVSYSEGCVEPGDYTITIVGKGNYGGTLELPFSIFGPVTYLDYNDGSFSEATCDDYRVVTPDRTELNAGWWVVNADTRLDQPITVSGNVRLILADGVTFTPSNGIRVNYNNSLTIYAQSEGENMGSLVVNNAPDGCAGIGGAYKQTHGTITINGGNITVKGDDAAGIGSGQDARSKSEDSYIYIHGGKINATGGSWSAGVGGGDYGSGGHIIITGGELTARGGTNSGGAGIGGSDGFSALEITITGGIVRASGGGNSPGIGGGGYWSSSGEGGRSGIITITGGQVTAKAGNGCSNAIGSAFNSPDATGSDRIVLGWTDVENDYISLSGACAGAPVSFAKPFVLDGTTTIVTTDNIADSKIVPLRQLSLDGLDEAEAGFYAISGNLKVVALCDDYAAASDGQDNWIKLTGDISALSVDNVINNVAGTLSIDDAGNPSFEVVHSQAVTASIDVTTAAYELSDVDLIEISSLKSGQVVTLTGYYNATYQALTGWSGKNGNSGVKISVSAHDGTEFTAGQLMKVTGMVSYKAAWNAAGAPRMLRGKSDYLNLAIDVLSSEELDMTGITDLNTDTAGEVRYFDINGRYMGNDLQALPAGIYIGSDGNKAVKR